MVIQQFNHIWWLLYGLELFLMNGSLRRYLSYLQSGKTWHVVIYRGFWGEGGRTQPETRALLDNAGHGITMRYMNYAMLHKTRGLVLCLSLIRLRPESGPARASGSGKRDSSVKLFWIRSASFSWFVFVLVNIAFFWLLKIKYKNIFFCIIFFEIKYMCELMCLSVWGDR